MKHRILLIEDDPILRKALLAPLQDDGHDVVLATRRSEALAQLALNGPTFDLALLDLGLPDGNGEDLIDPLNAAGVPVMVLSAEYREHTKVKMLNAGAEDYLVKPFSIPELQARMRVVTRRKEARARPRQMRHEFGDLVVDTRAHQVWRAGQPVHLTPIEFKLLEKLLEKPGGVVLRRDLLVSIWGTHAADQTHYLRLYISQLRQKLEDNPASPVYLINEPGVGYKFCAPQSAIRDSQA